MLTRSTGRLDNDQRNQPKVRFVTGRQIGARFFFVLVNKLDLAIQGALGASRIAIRLISGAIATCSHGKTCFLVDAALESSSVIGDVTANHAHRPIKRER